MAGERIAGGPQLLNGSQRSRAIVIIELHGSVKTERAVAVGRSPVLGIVWCMLRGDGADGSAVQLGVSSASGAGARGSGFAALSGAIASISLGPGSPQNR